MEAGPLLVAVATMRAAYDEVAALSVDQPTHAELLTVLTEMEAMTWQMPTIGHRIIARLQREASPKELGAKSLKAVLTTRLRISDKETARRLAEAEELGPRTSFTGESMPPVRAEVADARARGLIGPEHVDKIRGFFTKLPIGTDPETLESSEQTLVDLAATFCPEVLGKAADRLAALIDQDGPEPDDAERARKRWVRISPQQADGMSKLAGNMSPELRAMLEPVLAKLTAPGMCNPADPVPCVSGTPSQEQIDRDDRSHGQRVHDALLVISRIVLMTGELGHLNGLPVTVIVSTTLQDLQAAADASGSCASEPTADAAHPTDAPEGASSGTTATTPVTGPPPAATAPTEPRPALTGARPAPAVAGGGSLLPMSDLIRMASHARHYLAVFDEHTSEALYLGRTKRLAQRGQRIMLHARDRGCTFPGCTVAGYGTQVHHTTGWKDGGHTDIGKLTLACGGDNRLAEEGWNVTIRNGTAEWAPPPHLDTGQTRVNFYHHPERLLAPPGDDEPEPELGIGA